MSHKAGLATIGMINIAITIIVIVNAVRYNGWFPPIWGLCAWISSGILLMNSLIWLWWMMSDTPLTRKLLRWTILGAIIFSALNIFVWNDCQFSLLILVDSIFKSEIEMFIYSITDGVISFSIEIYWLI